MKTDFLYLGELENCYKTNFEATVIHVKPDWVMLDQTLFYPEGGGQPWDLGTLQSDGNTLNVTEVSKRGPVKHVVGQNHGLVEGSKVAGAIDWERRYAHMRMHTAQHLVSGLAYEMFAGVRTHGNQIHADRSRVDLGPIQFTDENLRDLSVAFNDVVKANHAITDTTMTREEINSVMPEDRTNMDLLPKSIMELRIIRIGNDLDLCPCAGTHVKSTGELGEIEIIGRKSKGANIQRVEYLLRDA